MFGHESHPIYCRFLVIIDIAVIRIAKSKNREQAYLPLPAAARKINKLVLDSSFVDQSNAADSNDTVIQKVQVRTFRDNWNYLAQSGKFNST